jgi:hypothetical protein
MSDSNQETPSSNPQFSLDLSALDSLVLGPDWSSGNAQNAPKKFREYEDKRESNRAGTGRPPPRRDRRFSAPKDENRAQGERPRGERRSYDAPRREREMHAPFVPVVNVDIYPEDAPFKALTQAIRSSHRTFELFEIARLILEKPERFVVVVHAIGNSPISLSVPDSIPFESEEQALNHVFTTQLNSFFAIEEIEVEAPKGNYLYINKCGVTGELLGPPNYHRYQQLLQQHFKAAVKGMPYDRFLSRIEKVSDEGVVQEWLAKMTKQTRYRLLGSPDENPTIFDNLESARFHLLTHCKEKLVKSVTTLRLNGRVIEQMPENSAIRRSIQMSLDHQRRFPLDTANHLRGRMRRLNFAIYKKGSKGVSYICAVKRKFREFNQRFAESVQELIDFIEAHPNILAAALPVEFLGVKIPVEGSEGSEPLTPENEVRLVQLRNDLHWLVSEGYVIEYSDGRLFAPSAASEVKAKVESDVSDAVEVDEYSDESLEPVSVEADSSKTEVVESDSEVFSENKTDPSPAE